MSTFSPSDKVICINSIPLPRNSARHSIDHDFSFPGGFIEEGEVYCVESVEIGSDGDPLLILVGKPVFQDSGAIGWNARHFHKVAPRKRSIAAKSKQHLLGRQVKDLVHRI